MQTEIKYILASLKYQLAVMKSKGEVMDKASWLRQMGVILSGEDAEILIKYLNNNINENSN